MLTLSALFAEMLSIIAVDDIAYQQQRERYKKYDGRKSVHLRCDRLFCQPYIRMGSVSNPLPDVK